MRPIHNAIQKFCRRSTLFPIAMAVVFACCLNGLRLRQSDLWDHVNYGRVMLATGGLPEVEPLLPLASDCEFINPAWGSQVLMAACVDCSELGLAGIQTAHSMLVLLCISIIGIAVAIKSGSAVFAILTSVFCLYVNWQQFLVVRPQTLGLLFFTWLFVFLSQKNDRHRWGQALIVSCFVIWANLHGSFTMGLFLIGIVGIGRLMDLAAKRWAIATRMEGSPAVSTLNVGTITQSLNRSGFTRLLILGLCCAAAVLINPYGIRIYEEVFRVGSHPNMQSMNEWRPLSLSMKQGRAAAYAAFTVMICLFASGRRLQMQNFLPLVLLAGLMLWSSRMINWWAPVAAYLIGIHVASAFRKIGRRIQPTRKKHQTATHFAAVNLSGTVMATVFIFLTSSLGKQTLGNNIPEVQLLEQRTPVNIAAFIKADGPDRNHVGNSEDIAGSNIVFCPAEWAGYLMSESRLEITTQNDKPELIFPLRPMVSTHVHVISPEVWNDFLRIFHGQPNSVAILQRYKIKTVIVNPLRQQRLVERLTMSEFCEQIYDSPTGQLWMLIR